MSILSNLEIQARMKKGELILDGDESRIRSCHYEVTPGKIIRTGDVEDRDQVVDWTDVEAHRADIEPVLPGAMVWMRTRERVKMPHDVCAFWWQTNTLSKQGLMLVNASMVDPGYEGLLACLFVNFGKQQILINPETRVAKLIFVTLDSATTHPYLEGGAEDKSYDRNIKECALNAPHTFLGVHELSTSLASERKKALEDIRIDGENARKDLAKDFENAGKQARADLVTGFQQDAKAGILKAAGWAAAGFILLVAATSLVPWAQKQLQPDLKAVLHSVVQEEINNRVQFAGAPNADIIARLNALSARIDSIRAKR